METLQTVHLVMDIPVSIKLLGKRLKISMVTSGQIDVAGSFCDYRNEINLHSLDEGLSEEEQAETFLHEILEAINSKLELNLKHNRITAIAAVLFHVMRDNKLDFSHKVTNNLRNGANHAKD